MTSFEPTEVPTCGISVCGYPSYVSENLELSGLNAKDIYHFKQEQNKESWSKAASDLMISNSLTSSGT